MRGQRGPAPYFSFSFPFLLSPLPPIPASPSPLSLSAAHRTLLLSRPTSRRPPTLAICFAGSGEEAKGTDAIPGQGQEEDPLPLPAPAAIQVRLSLPAGPPAAPLSSRPAVLRFPRG